MTVAHRAMDDARPRSLASLVLLGCLGLAAFVGLLELGTWQVHRRVWKLALIEHVDQRLHAAPVAAPGPAAWAKLTAADDEYTRLTLTGAFVDTAETLVQATTALGGGFWVMTPFRTDRGFTVLVNRGFVTPEQRDPASRPGPAIAGPAHVTGLLRMSEPGGAFLHTNDPADNRWYSRDVAAIAQARGVAPVAPYFVDADANADRDAAPVGGLTIIAFPNSHLVYAITWYVLALMVAAAFAYTARAEWRRRRG